jgi:hypothetical protein
MTQQDPSKMTQINRDQNIAKMQNDIKKIETQILREEKKILQKQGFISKMVYGMIALCTFSLVLSGLLAFQNNASNSQFSNADAVYTCSKDEKLDGAECLIPIKIQDGAAPLACSAGYKEMGKACVQSTESTCASFPKAVVAETGLCKIDPAQLSTANVADVMDVDGRECATGGYNFKRFNVGVTLNSQEGPIVCGNTMSSVAGKENFRFYPTRITGEIKTLQAGSAVNKNLPCPTGYSNWSKNTLDIGGFCARPATTTGCTAGGEYLDSADNKCKPCPAGKYCPATGGNSSQVTVCANGGTLSADKTRCTANNKFTITKYSEGCKPGYIKMDQTCATKEVRTLDLGCTYFYASENESIKAIESGTLAGEKACSTGGRADFASTSIVQVSALQCDGPGTAWYNYNVRLDPLVCGTSLAAGKTSFRWTSTTYTEIRPLEKIASGEVKECPQGWMDAGGDSCYQAPITITYRGPIDCVANTYAPAGATTCTPCPAGSTSPANSTSAQACVNQNCTNGAINPPKCDVCPSGSELKNGICTKIVVVVPENKPDTRVVKEITITKPETKKEPCVSNPGYYTDQNGNCQICPIGYYCPGNTNNPIICPVGTTTEYQGAKAVAECKPTQKLVVATPRTGGFEVFAIGTVVAAIFGLGYYFFFVKNSKSKINDEWTKL